MDDEWDTTKLNVLGEGLNHPFPVTGSRNGGKIHLVRNFDAVIPRQYILEWRNDGTALEWQWIKYVDKMFIENNVRVTLLVMFVHQVPAKKNKQFAIEIGSDSFMDEIQRCIPDTWCEITIDKFSTTDKITFVFQHINHPQIILIARFEGKIL